MIKQDRGDRMINDFMAVLGGLAVLLFKEVERRRMPKPRGGDVMDVRQKTAAAFPPSPALKAPWVR
jgi:hypothetical protein